VIRSGTDKGYEECAHLYDLFDTKDNIEFFLSYASEAGAVFMLLPLSRLRDEPYGSRQGERKNLSPSLLPLG
jgi:hypothetical protein